MKKVYITTTLPYINAEPHIGHAREFVQADCLARFERLRGNEVFLNVGTDEHGAKILEKAEEVGLEPVQYTNRQAEIFKDFCRELNISQDRFIRTTDLEHIAAAQKFWQICDGNGFIYKKKYKANYCVGCELEKTNSELIDGKCADHPNRELEKREEENYFFKFSQFQTALLDFYENNPGFVVPEKRFNEIKKFVANGLEDFSISRLKEKMSWGVEVPGDPEHVMYVWFDALVNYVSTLGWFSFAKASENKFSVTENAKSEVVNEVEESDLNGGKNFKKFWEEGDERIQFCGKDNLRQQSAMWQAMLLAAEIKNSTRVFVNGFITVADQKMSKSLGNVIAPSEMVSRYGVDGVRYLLLSAGSFGEDTDMTWERLDEKYNADLANGLGNLVSRVIKLGADVEWEGKEEKFGFGSEGEKLKTGGFDEVLKMIWDKIKEADKLMEERKPWELKKSSPDEFETVMSQMIGKVEWIGRALQPFLPETAEKIKEAIEERVTEPLFKRLS